MRKINRTFYQSYSYYDNASISRRIDDIRWLKNYYYYL